MWHKRKPVLLLSVFLSSCASMEVARQVQSGRTSLRFDNPKGALSHFEVAARINPNYVTNFTPLDIGIWTYIGRSYYEMGDKEKALEAFERARAEQDTDYLARIYLGFLMAEDGSRREGVEEMKTGLAKLGDWLHNLPGIDPEGRHWDPAGSPRRFLKRWR